MRKHCWKKAWFCGVAAVGGVLCSATVVTAQYEAPWPSKVQAGTAHLDDVGTDVVSDSLGNSYVVAWVRISETKTSYRLRIYRPDGSTDASTLTRTWGPNNGIHKAYSVAIRETVHLQGGQPVVDTVDIYITGESHSTNGTNGQDIVTLMYTYIPAAPGYDYITSANPLVQRFDGAAHDDDIGLDVTLAGDPLNGGHRVVVTGTTEGSTTGLDSITIGINPDALYFTSKDEEDGYWVYLYDPAGDDATVMVTRGPDQPQNGTVCVAGYTQGDDDDDFLTLRLNAEDGSYVEGWQYGTPSDERANALVSAGIYVYVTGWTNATSMPVDPGDGPGDPIVLVGPNYLTVRFDPGDPDPAWARLLNGTGNDADIAYSIAFLPSITFNANDPEGEVTYPEALVVSGASTGDGTDLDYRVVLYDTFDGSVMDADESNWTHTGDGIYNNDLLDGPDEAFAMGVDWKPGQIYVTGRTTRTNASVDTFDFGTVRFIRNTGEWDDGNAAHVFPPFFFNGTANDDDSVLALSVNNLGNAVLGYERDPVVFVTGYTVDTSEQEDIRTIKYKDRDHDD